MVIRGISLLCALLAIEIACTPAFGDFASVDEKMPSYKLIKKVPICGDGGWDDLTIDSAAQRCYISHQKHVVVFDITAEKVIGDINNTPGVHCIALAQEFSKGYISNGGDNTVTVFDLKTLKEINRVKVGTRPDAIIFDPATKYVFTFNGRSDDCTVIDANNDTVIRTIPVGGKPEFAVSDGKGQVFVNIEDKSEIVAIDAKKLIAIRRWPLAPCEEPSGLAIDCKNNRLFSVCSNGKMAITDYTNGKLIATPEIGRGPDGAAFDAETGLAFSSNGQDGTLTVIKEQKDGQYKVITTVTTAPGARTMKLDPKTHRIYLVTAKPKNPAPGEPQGGRVRSYEPGSFELLIVGPAKE